MHLDSRLKQGILTVEIVNPPVNCLSLDIRRSLYETFTLSATDPDIAAIVLTGSGKYFCAGGDLSEMGTPAASAEPRLSADLLPAIERCPKAIIAAIHGAAIGGGFELALACHYRIALGNARIALPEIRHGIIPLSGTIRLPRIWAVDRALSMIMSSAAVTAEDFRGSAVFDCLVPCVETKPDIQREILLLATRHFVTEQLLGGSDQARHSIRLVRNRPAPDDAAREVFELALTHHATGGFNRAQTAAVAAIRAGLESDFEAALQQAQRLYDDLIEAMPGR